LSGLSGSTRRSLPGWCRSLKVLGIATEEPSERSAPFPSIGESRGGAACAGPRSHGWRWARMPAGAWEGATAVRPCGRGENPGQLRARDDAASDSSEAASDPVLRVQSEDRYRLRPCWAITSSSQSSSSAGVRTTVRPAAPTCSMKVSTATPATLADCASVSVPSLEQHLVKGHCDEDGIAVLGHD